MQRTVYIIGHKNPDTDSIAAATAYAHLKQTLGMSEALAARAGAANPQTEYVFNRFGVELPVFVPDLVPRVEYYLSDEAPTVSGDTPLWEALALMGQVERKVLPIVDGQGRYQSMLHYSAFAENILTKINPHKKAVVPTSISHLISTIKAQPIVVHDRGTLFKARTPASMAMRCTSSRSPTITTVFSIGSAFRKTCSASPSKPACGPSS
ncbi:MAG TPA: DHH family phosphoesterase [Deltaproteobacteria bacterium]|nr:DHH family phosphoesterase [Deltaproteobacteria bacterium]